MPILTSQFYARDSWAVAPDLLGCILLHKRTDGSNISGRIVETEAYHWTDPASHSFRGQTKRNSPLFSAPGTIYIYFTYGMHYCLNVVTGPEGEGQGVLIRALEPLQGIEAMKHHRCTELLGGLCNGPAKLVQALGIDPALNSGSFTDDPLTISTGRKPKIIAQGPRIGIREGKETKWRFYDDSSPYVSGPKRH